MFIEPTRINHFRSDDTGIATDPNSIKVGGDIKMDLDLNEAIKEDAKLQEEPEPTESTSSNSNPETALSRTLLFSPNCSLYADLLAKK